MTRLTCMKAMKVLLIGMLIGSILGFAFLGVLWSILSLCGWRLM